MGNWAPVAELQPGDWITKIGNQEIDEYGAKVIQVTSGFVFNGVGEWGVTLADGQSVFCRGPVETTLAYKATPEEAVMLDLDESSRRAEKRAEREARRKVRDSSAERTLQRFLRRTR